MHEDKANGFMAFLCVVEQGSFTRAAGYLGVSTSAVSQRIKLLEAKLGARLLNRTTRSAKPTQAGLDLAQQLRGAFHQLDAAAESGYAALGKIGGKFRLTVSGVAASLLVAPHAGGFRRRHPELQLAVSVSDRRVDLVEEGFDAGLRRGDLVGADMVSQRISPETKMIVVAAPNYLKRRAPIEHPGQLRNHDCIAVSNPTDGVVSSWRFKHQDVSINMKVDAALVVDTPTLALAAAMSGAGLAYLAYDYAERLIAAGDMVPLLEPWNVIRPGFFLYYPRHQHALPAAHAFGAFMRSAQKQVKHGAVLQTI